MALTQSEISHRAYMRRRDSGLCPRCGEKLDRQGYYCSKCLKKANDYNREVTEFCRQFKICPQCRKNKLFGDEKTCPECLAKKAEYNSKHPQDNKKYAENFKRQQKRLYQERKANGICTRCGKRKAYPGKAKCKICLDKDVLQHRKASFNKPNIKEYRHDNHLCYHCGKPIDRETGELCQSCWNRCRENGLKSSNDNPYWRQDDNIVFIKNRGVKK